MNKWVWSREDGIEWGPCEFVLCELCGTGPGRGCPRLCAVLRRRLRLLLQMRRGEGEGVRGAGGWCTSLCHVGKREKEG